MRGCQNLPVLRFQHHLQTLKGRPVHVGPSLWLRSSFFNNSCRCLDAAHGEGRGTVHTIQHEHGARTEMNAACAAGTGPVREIGRGRPKVALGPDVRQGSRRAVAVARSRRSKAVARMNAAEGAEQWFLRRMSLRSPCTVCRAQPAGHACGPPLREAAARTAL